MSAGMSRAQTSAMLKASGEVLEERLRQHLLWGQQDHPNGTGHPGDLLASKAARDWTERQAERGTVTYRDILEEEVREAFAESDPAKLRAELIQVAAVAVAWVEKLDRQREDVYDR